MKLGQIFFFVLLLFSLNVIAADDVSRLDAAKKALQSNDEIEQFRGYNECKTIYLRANLNKNTDLARDALNGIVKGGETLGIDVSKYKTELAKLQPSIPTIAAAIVQEPAVSAVKSAETLQKPLVFPKEYMKVSGVQRKEAPNTFITPTGAQLFKFAEPVKVSVENESVKRRRLVETKWKDTGLELLFDTPVNANEIHLSKIIESDKQRFRYIIDIDSATLAQTKILEHKNINQIRMAQYDSKTLRMVIEHNQAIAIKPVTSGSSIYIDLSLQTMTKEQPVSPPVAILKAPVPELPPLIEALPPLVNVTRKDRSKKVIVIDPGHGGKDSGAVGNGYMEKNIVLQVSLELSDQLKAMGYTVYMTRSTDVFIELKDRTKFANDKMADLFLSIHANAIPKGSDANAAYGIETYFLSPGRSERAMRVAALENSEDMGEMGEFGKLSFLNVLNTEKIIASNKLAIDIQKGVLNNLRKQFPNVKDNGAREAPFWVLVGAQMPAILLEIGYISNPDESARIADSKYQKWMVEGMLDGIKHYFANNP
ncbi:MAG: N-acetylmuramoyl-L-alanine amidase [Sulfuricurvum sp.]|nr:N-acetylmuramoyl-L-alanine amidase [Sulfuricurvum sp.]MDP3022665.1 N-acetylmuramoyl-L-alanine amidase [Sulfuricurvum sp.]